MKSSVAATALVVLFALTGCQTAPSGLPDEVSVSVYQTRSDGAVRQVQVQVSNSSAQALTVVGLSIDSTRFVETAPFDKPGRVPPNSAVVPAGATRDLPVRLPAASCDGSPARDVVSFDFEWADGRRGNAEVTIADTEVLEQLTAVDCFAKAVTDIVTLPPPAQAEWMPGAHSPATLTIGATPTGADGRVTIDSIGATTLLAPVTEGGTPLASAPFDVAVDALLPPTTIELRVQPARCDPHAIAEDKKGTILPLTISVEGGATGIFALPVSDEVRVSLYDYVTDWCGAER